jgi:hypothetical protein
LLVPLLLSLGCGKLLGITDTVVTTGVGGTGAVASAGGSAGEVASAGGSGGVGGSDSDTLGGAQGGGAPLGMGGSAGASPASGACAEGVGRCVAAGREVCTGGVFQAAVACPLDKPTCDAGECSVRGPTLVPVAGGMFFIDATEVTVGQYAEFLTAKNGDTSGQPADVCGWNDSYQPAALQNPSDWPASDVDWCDARAYCEWAGKHLCRDIGNTGPLAYDDLFVSSASQWFLACGGPNGAAHVNANSNNQDDTACNANNGFGNLEPVSTPACSISRATWPSGSTAVAPAATRGPSAGAAISAC